MEVGVEKNTYEGHVLEVMPSHKKTQKWRGRSRKNKEIGGEGNLLTELSAHPAAKQFTMQTICLGSVGTSIRGSRR
jgi:hypothetical protein